MDQPNRPANTHPGEHFRAEMAEAGKEPRQLSGMVRLAFGERPPGLAGNPPSGPEVTAVRSDARAALLAEGWLTEHELGSLPVAEAETLALRRFEERSDERGG